MYFDGQWYTSWEWWNKILNMNPDDITAWIEIPPFITTKDNGKD